MLSRSSLNKIVHNKYVQGFLKSREECRRDNRGGFLIPITVKLTDPEYERYRHLEVNWAIAPVSKDILPDEFSPQAAKTVEMFRRKTIDLDYECMILFDYITGNLISCNFSDDFENDKVETEVYPDVLKNMHIASAHNHPNQYCSPPSGKNFQMLGLEFEDFELIFSKNEMWILESKRGVFDDDEIDKIRENANDYFDACYDNVNCDFEEGYLLIDYLNRCYGDKLLNYINKKFDNISLIRRYLYD